MRDFAALMAICLTYSWATVASGVQPDRKTTPIGFALGERSLTPLAADPPTVAPVGPVHSLAEWEQSDGVMTLWTNESWVRELARRGPVKLIADGASERDWWARWLREKKIDDTRVSYFVTPTDTIWVRDYGPWFIVDGRGDFGLVDTTYNRPRPQDDVFPEFVSRELDIPLYRPGLVHTGGNYYNDGVGGGFSSTLPFTENGSLSADEVRGRMRDYLGIDRYTTSRLAPGITIEHLDTFGKLVAPDTWVFSDFPEGSRYRADSESYVALLKTLKSPYGTPYRIHRMPMVRVSSGSDSYRAYINSFISNGALYFPTYGDDRDDVARRVYQEALPAYEIVGVDGMGTQWGDSVHCRSRNLLARDTIFLFPRVVMPTVAGGAVRVEADAIPSPGAELDGAPTARWTTPDGRAGDVVMTRESGFHYAGALPEFAPGTTVSMYVEATDTRGKHKTAPMRAPAMRIEFQVGGRNRP